MNTPHLPRPLADRLACSRSTVFCLTAFCLTVFCSTGNQLLLAQTNPGSTLKAYPLRNLRADQVEAQVIRALAELPERATVAVDPRSNQILVRGTDRAQKLAQHVIESVDRGATVGRQNEARQGGGILRSYPLRGQNLGARLARLQAQFGSIPGVRLAADHRGSAILVEAPADVHQQIARQINEVPAARPAQQVNATAVRTPNESAAPAIRRDIQLRNVTWKSVYASLQDLLQRPIPAAQQRGGRTVAYWITARDAPGVELHVDAEQGQIAIHGPADQVRGWSRVIEAIDSPPATSSNRTEIVALQRSDPRQVRYAVTAFSTANRPATQHTARIRLNRPGLRMLTSLIQHNAVANGAQGTAKQPQPKAPDKKTAPNAPPATKQIGEITGGGLIGPVQIEFIEGTDTIIIRGHPKDVDRVLKIIKDIEAASVETKPTIRVQQLRFVDSESMSDVVGPLYQQTFGARLGTVSITALVKPNALLLIGREESIKAVLELIERLDTPVPASSQFRVFRLHYAAALEALAMIQQFYGDRVANTQLRRPALGTKLLVTADQRSNSLIVRGGPRDLDELAELIKQIDTPSSEAVNQLRVFQLKNSLAEELAPVLQAAISAQTGQQQTGAGGAQQPTPQIQPGQQGGTSRQVRTKSSMLQFLAIDPEGQRVLKSGILADVRVTADVRGNTLLVSAPAESMDLLAALIRQLDQVPAAEAQVKVFTILNADASSLAEMLDGLFGQQQGQGQIALPSATGSGESSLIGLRFSVDPRTNSIIASGASADLNVVEAILLRLDESDVRQRKSVVYRLQNSPAVDVANAINEFLRSERDIQAVQPDILSPFEQIEREVVVVPEPVSNSLIVSATPRYFDEVTKLVEQLDKRPPMVMIQVLIAEVTLNDFDEFGLELGVQDDVLFRRSSLADLLTTSSTTSTSTPAGVVTTTEDTIQAASNTPGFNFNNQPLGNSGSDQALQQAAHIATQALSTFGVGRINNELGFGGLVLSASSEAVSVLFRALQQNRRTEILARPQIMTLDNQPAFVQVGQRVPRITASNITETGTINTTVLENVGLLLGVTPRISPDGLVVMEIDVEKSEVGPEAEGIPISISSSGDVIRSPRINTTTAQTTVSAMSGQTIVLSGLITKSYSETERRIPLLSDIPILGDAFRFSSVTEDRTELLIIMTPHVVRDEKDAEWIKQVESARMSWVMSDVMEIHGDAGIRGRTDDWKDSETDTHYPDHENGDAVMPPLTETAPRPLPTPASTSSSRRRAGPAALRPVEESRLRTQDRSDNRLQFPNQQSSAYLKNNPYQSVRPASYDWNRSGLSPRSATRFDRLPAVLR